MHSLKTKLVVTITLLIIILFGLTAVLFVGEKQRELTQDIYLNARSFAELTAPKMVNDYNLYLAQKSFVYFNREVQDVFSKFQDLASLQVVDYSGKLVYDSATEKEKQYEGSARPLDNPMVIAQVKAKNPSVFTLDTQRLVFLKKSADGTFLTVDENEQPVQALAPDEKIAYLVQPGSNDFAVIYHISYEHLQERVNQTTMRGILLGIFGVGIAVALAFFYAGGITKPLKGLTEGAQVIATGNFAHRVEVKTKDEIATLGNAFNKMAADLEVSTKAMVYKERVAKELELASKIQKNLLPKEMPKVMGLDVSAGLLPAEEIGGDCYDFIKVDEDNLLMYIGDVTGHGVPSGIVVSIANALIYHMAGRITDIKTLVVDLNRVIKEKSTSSMFITLAMLNYHIPTGKLTFVNAGHEQMIHFHASDKKVTLTPMGGLAVGMFPDISKNLKQEEIMLEKDDVLVLYSDGIPESWKDDKEMYGMARFKRAVTEYSNLPSAMAIRNALLADVKEFSGKYKQMDDITLIVLKRN